MKQLLLFTLSLICTFSYAQCDNVTDGGAIGYEEMGCSPFDPSEIQNLVTPTGGVGQLEYMWLWTHTPQFSTTYTVIPGANGPTYDPPVITETTWYIRCTRRAGCPDWVGEAEVKKEVYDLVVPIDVSHVGCNSLGTIEISAWGGVAPYSMFVNNSPVNGTLTGLSAGTYFVLVEDALGCSYSEYVEVESATDLEINVTVNDETCASLNDNAIVYVSGGTWPFDYLWSDGTQQWELEDPINGLSGTYTILVTDDQGCSATDSISFDQGHAAAQIQCCQDTVICSGGAASIAVQLQGNAPWVLTWNEGATTFSDTVYQSPYYIQSTSNSTAQIELVSVYSASCGFGAVCGKATVAVRDCTNGGCIDGCFYSYVEDSYELNNGCTRYEMVVRGTDCTTELSNMTISIPCGVVTNMSNNFGFDMTVIDQPDPNTGLSGIKIDNISGFGANGHLSIQFDVCEGECEAKMSPNCLPLIAYKAGNCVLYESTMTIQEYHGRYFEILRMDVWPNPFKENCFIEVQAGSYREDYNYGRIWISDLNGTILRTIRIGQLSINGGLFEWDGKNNDGREVEAGVYLINYAARDYRSEVFSRVIKLE